MLKKYSDPLVSIIIRTKNEEQWIKPLLAALKNQTYKKYEIIIVDNNSNDKTLALLKRHGICKILNIAKYNPSAALNIGVEVAAGDICVFLSAHCVPASQSWLEELIKPICQAQSICSYGRQIPTSNSSSDNSRDLLMTFGKEALLQKDDFKFHNANSAISTNAVQKYKFDEKLTNIEDWHWAKKIIELGHTVSYTPTAIVFHDHGIHQHSNQLKSFRADPVARLLIDAYRTDSYEEPFLDVDNWTGLIIVSGEINAETLTHIQDSFEQRIVVNTVNSVETATEQVLKVNLDKKLGFHDFLKGILRKAELHFDEIFDYIVFLDYHYEKINPRIAKENCKQLFKYWADVASFGKLIKGKRLQVIDNQKVIIDTLYPSDAAKSKDYELILGQGAAMRSYLFRGEQKEQIRYRLSGTVDGDEGHKL